MNVSNEDEKLAHLRTEYEGPTLLEWQLAADPISQFRLWFDEAVAADMVEPNAMVLSTVDATGHPRQRTVLLKHVDTAGFTFFTNYESAKATDIAGQPWVSLLFGWYGLHRQVIVSGRAARVPETDSDRYFTSRPYGSRLAAWASRQSQVIADREVLDNAYARVAREHPHEVPRPSRWGGFTVAPQQVEFWQGRTNRLHDRLRYSRDREDAWVVQRLAPLANKLGSLPDQIVGLRPCGTVPDRRVFARRQPCRRECPANGRPCGLVVGFVAQQREAFLLNVWSMAIWRCRVKNGRSVMPGATPSSPR